MEIKIDDSKGNILSGVSAEGSPGLVYSNGPVSCGRTKLETRIVPVSDTTPVQTNFRPLRFAVGLLSTTAGVVLILTVGIFVNEMQHAIGDLTLPTSGILVLIGVMLLGGGFGLMATASAGFDEQEFDRLAAAGNISAIGEINRRGVVSSTNSARSAVSSTT